MSWTSGGNQNVRVFRGGSWFNAVNYSRFDDSIRVIEIKYFDGCFSYFRLVGNVTCMMDFKMVIPEIKARMIKPDQFI